MSTTTVVVLLTMPILALGLLMLLTTTMAAIFRRKVDKPPPAPVSQGTVPPEVQIRAMQLVARRRQLEAVKVVRDATGMSLKECKAYCDALRDGRIAPPVRKPLSDRVRAFLDDGDRDAAVALVQTETGMTRPEAARFVEALEP